MDCTLSTAVDLGGGDFEYSVLSCDDPYSTILSSQYETLTFGFYAVIFFLVLLFVIIYFRR